MLYIQATDISTCWAKAFVGITRERHPHEATPLVVEINLSDPGVLIENQDIKQLIDDSLSRPIKRHSTDTVANTIFPQRLWEKSNADRHEFYRRYGRLYERIKRKLPVNRKGTYFGRLIKSENNFNQIDHVISTYNDHQNHRRSALVATVFDYRCDHNNQLRKGFPCLHEVMFAPVGQNGLAISGIYAVQYMFDRAYGNYLGLARLGQFVAGELGKDLMIVKCIANTAALGNISVTNANAIADRLEIILQGRVI